MNIKARFRNLMRRMRTDGSRGSAAVEFAMVAPIFFLFLMATIEVGVIFFAQSALQNAVNDAARLVKTGQNTCFTTDANGNCQTMTQAQFRTQVCNEVGALLQHCAIDAQGNTDMQFDIRSYPAGFGGASNSSPLDTGNNLPNLNTFAPGNPCDVVLVRAFYKWHLFTPGLTFLLANMAGAYHLIATAAAFRNEPYTNNVAGC
ncbi:MAG TPA: TadE/TadG family type IV pilus assembly protein [Rhizomicrobium sp.]|nr:TadE/TadG family type IV pilus assembly protein [Rhizomicrobium sp.]